MKNPSIAKPASDSRNRPFLQSAQRSTQPKGNAHQQTKNEAQSVVSAKDTRKANGLEKSTLRRTLLPILILLIVFIVLNILIVAYFASA